MNILSQNGRMGYGITNLVVDTTQELQAIDTFSLTMGSTCYVIKTYTRYILSSDKKWYVYKNIGNNSPADDLLIAEDNEVDEAINDGLGD